MTHKHLEELSTYEREIKIFKTMEKMSAEKNRLTYRKQKKTLKTRTNVFNFRTIEY